MQETKRDFSKPVKMIYTLLSKEQQELMKFPLESMTGYIKETGDTQGKGAEKRFRVFMFLYRHWLISEKIVRADFFGKSFIQATTDELWDESQRLYIKLKGEKENDRKRSETVGS
ncbi:MULTISPECIES: hypothetical protein [unclassified Enterococcus]|uniref:hypothetical protein n=1 Tax=unclassified Enterococcus TaxID=2608891 RepID=UPI0019098483|nr:MULTISPECIES: hypothetical protein [unclassified Enterococcus]MBK0038353.1 hypothetical protein [Enterococcus sp. S52]MBK0141510.1 hypothetical protein [Enterococcus sp. S76]